MDCFPCFQHCHERVLGIMTQESEGEKLQRERDSEADVTLFAIDMVSVRNP